MPASAAPSSPARWRVAVGWLSEVLNWVSSIALVILIAVVVRDQGLSPALARLVLVWSVVTAILATIFTRWLGRADASGEPRPDTPAI
jgi:hypothetical protein